MMEEEFILEYDRIREFREKATIQINQYLEKLDLISQNINTIVEMESFQGKTAEHIKSYLGEVYPFLIGAMRSACEDFLLKLTLYADSFTEEVDGHAHARIPEGAMKDMQSHIRLLFSKMDNVVERANTAMAQVSDILPLERISTDEVAESYQNVLDYVKGKEDKISELDCRMCGQEIADTEKLITSTKHAIEEYSGKRVITTYQSGDWKNQKSTQELAEALQNHAVYTSENGEMLQKACENQERISRELQQEEAAEKRMERGLVQAGAGAAMAIGGAAVIVGSLGTATPAVLYAEAAIGANLAVYGTAETAEGVQNTILGAGKNVESESYNFLRDGVMQGNESAYLVYGKASSIAGVAALPLLAGYEGAVVAGGSKAAGMAKGLFLSGGAALAGYGTEKAATHFGASNTTGMALGMAAEFLATRGMTAGSKFASGSVTPTAAEVKVQWKRNYLTVREKAVLSKKYITEYKGKVIRGWKFMKDGRYLNNEFITPEGIRLQIGDAAEEVAQVKRAAGDVKDGTGTELKVIAPYDNNNYFTRAVEFNAGETGTGFTYKVYQRNDINWDMVRTTGAKKGRGLTNAQAAERYGLAPILNDGYVATLHHSQQRNVGPLFESSTRYHNISNAKKGPLHPYKGQLNPFNPMDSTTRSLFQKVDSIEYWKIRGKDAMKGAK